MTDLGWIAAALASTIIYAGVTVGDKLILTRLGIRLPAFYMFTGASQGIVSVFILAIDPPRGVPVYSALAGFGGGFFWGAGLTLMFWGLTREQVSRVAPVWHTSPIFVAIMAVLFLGESLGLLQWFAIMLVVFGAIAISVRSSDLGIGFSIRPIFLVIFFGAILIGSGQLLLKEGSADQSVWSLMAFRGLGLFTAMFVPYARPRTFAALFRYMRSASRAGAIVVNDGVGPVHRQPAAALGHRHRADIPGERRRGLTPPVRARHDHRDRPFGQQATAGRGDDAVGPGTEGDGNSSNCWGCCDNRRGVRPGLRPLN